MSLLGPLKAWKDNWIGGTPTSARGAEQILRRLVAAKKGVEVKRPGAQAELAAAWRDAEEFARNRS